MSRKQEPQTPLDLLQHKLDILGFAEEIAAKNLLASLAKSNAPAEVVEDVNNMVSIAASETKKRVAKKLEAMIEELEKAPNAVSTSLNR
jgi:benzoyl-CoA reductase/2-hydroxyglutaryl-CoA dehydratase subunit BcrC/BadD/HgdB